MLNESKRVFVVLGMHRSGTSAITRGLVTLGVELGSNLLPPIENENAKGYFEDVELFTLNVEILKALCMDWQSMSTISTTQIKFLYQNGFFFRAVSLIQQKLDGVSLFGLKDPRIAKLLPFWIDVFKHCKLEVSYVIAIRNPLSVTESLVKRSGLHKETSYLLWLGHVISSLSNTSHCNRVVVDFDSLLADPLDTLNQVAKHFSLILNEQEFKKYHSEFLDVELRHSLYSLNDLLNDDSCPSLVTEIYTKLLKVSVDLKQLTSVEFDVAIQQYQTEFNRYQPFLILGDKMTEELNQLEVVNKSLLEDGANLKQSVIKKEEFFLHHCSILEQQLTIINNQHIEREKQLENQLSQLQSRHEQNLLLLHDNSKLFYDQLVDIEKSQQKKLIEEITSKNVYMASLNYRLQLIEQILLKQEAEKKQSFSFLIKYVFHKKVALSAHNLLSKFISKLKK